MDKVAECEEKCDGRIEEDDDDNDQKRVQEIINSDDGGSEGKLSAGEGRVDDDGNMITDSVSQAAANINDTSTEAEQNPMTDEGDSTSDANVSELFLPYAELLIDTNWSRNSNSVMGASGENGRRTSLRMGFSFRRLPQSDSFLGTGAPRRRPGGPSKSRPNRNASAPVSRQTAGSGGGDSTDRLCQDQPDVTRNSSTRNRASTRSYRGDIPHRRNQRDTDATANASSSPRHGGGIRGGLRNTNSPLKNFSLRLNLIPSPSPVHAQRQQEEQQSRRQGEEQTTEENEIQSRIDDDETMPPPPLLASPDV